MNCINEGSTIKKKSGRVRVPREMVNVRARDSPFSYFSTMYFSLHYNLIIHSLLLVGFTLRWTMACLWLDLDLDSIHYYLCMLPVPIPIILLSGSSLTTSNLILLLYFIPIPISYSSILYYLLHITGLCLA